MDALLSKTGAQLVFGVSSGAIIWLEAARTLRAIRKAAIFEPPLLLGSPVPTDLLTRFDAEIAAGDIAAALVTGMKAARLAPPVFDLMPRWLLERMTRAMLASEDKKAASRDVGDVTVRMLAPTLHYDFELVMGSRGPLEAFRDIEAELLLLSGSKSPAFLRAAVEALARALPNADRIELAGVGHTASGNTDDPMTGRGARPELVAQTLRRFFA